MKIRHSRINIQGSAPTLRAALTVRRAVSRGFTYIALLVAIVIIGISLGAVTRYWSNISLREKEEELLFRGDQYRKAIESYTRAVPGRVEFPASIDDLLADNRTAVLKRHLRRKYKDPVSGEDFVEIRDQTTRHIIGVNSPSDKEPLKQANFPEEDRDFEGKKKYSEWRFLYIPQPGQLPPGYPLPQGALPPSTPGMTLSPGVSMPAPVQPPGMQN